MYPKQEPSLDEDLGHTEDDLEEVDGDGAGGNDGNESEGHAAPPSLAVCWGLCTLTSRCPCWVLLLM